MAHTGKSRSRLPPYFGDPRPQPPSSPLSSYAETCKKHCRARRKARALKADYFEKDRKNRDWYSSVCFDWDTCSLSFGHHTLLSGLSAQSNAGGVPLQSHLSVTKSILPMLLAKKCHYIRAVYYRIYRLANRSTR